MYRYMHPQEIALLGLDEHEFERFMRAYTYERLEGFSPKSSVQLALTNSETQLVLESGRVFANPDGREVRFDFTFYMSDDGPFVSTALLSLVVGGCYSELSAGQPFPTGLEKFRYLIQCYERHLPTWHVAGIDAFVRTTSHPNPDSLFELRRFDVAIEGMKRTVASFESTP
jgi:hypothetical protein